MNLISGIWQGAKVLLGFSGASKGSENVMAIANGVGKFIDEQNFTEEEAHEQKLKVATAYVDYMQASQSENTQRSITRREIAIWVIRMEMVALVLYGALGSFKIEAAGVWKEIAFDSPLALLALGVGAFFFGTHLLRSAKG